MKIAIFSFYSGEVSRGVETYVHELSNELFRLGHGVTVYQNGPERQGSKYQTETIKLAVDWKKSSGNLPFLNYRSLLIKKFTEISIKKINTDIDVVITTNGQWQSVLVRKWARKNKVKHIISGQSGPGIDDRINLATTPDSFVALTDYQRNWAQKAVPLVKNRIDKIPNGVDMDKFYSAKACDLSLSRPIILNVAALESSKGQEYAIRAVAGLKKGSLLLVGSGSQVEKYRQLGDKLLTNRFKIISVPFEDMPQIYKASDIFTFPTSPWESFGIAMLEAMASGLPVVASDDPIRREIVGKAGLFVNPKNTDEYSKVLQNAIDTDWKNIPLTQAKKYSWEIIAREHQTLFEDLVNEN